MNAVGRTADGTGIMFLNEAALGKEHTLLMDDYRLTAPPSGRDCIIARGQTEPGRTIIKCIKPDTHWYVFVYVFLYLDFHIRPQG